jgi:hypothetical protein
MILTLLVGLWDISSMAQGETGRTLAERSAIVVRGTVLRVNASEEPLQVASPSTVVIKVSRMYAGTEIAGDQTGRNVTVILSRPSRLKEKAEALFFGNPRFIGKSLTIVDEGEILATSLTTEAANLEAGLQARRDKPIMDRLAIASMVFRGKVESVRPLEGVTDRKQQPVEHASEHDPEWQVARVTVINSLRGTKEGALVTIIFPASRDIMWFNSPKLEPGQDAVFITHKPEKEDAQFMRSTGVTRFVEKEPAELVTQPFDVLPASAEVRVRRLVTKEVR